MNRVTKRLQKILCHEFLLSEGEYHRRPRLPTTSTPLLFGCAVRLDNEGSAVLAGYRRQSHSPSVRPASLRRLERPLTHYCRLAGDLHRPTVIFFWSCQQDRVPLWCSNLLRNSHHL